MKKSLKEEHSIKQINNDLIMGISVQPENTCPVIDNIKTSHRSTKFSRSTTEIKLGEDSEVYIVNVSPVLERTEDLKNWCTDIISLFEDNIEKNVDNAEDYEEKLDLIKEIKDYINQDIAFEVEKLAENVNSSVEEWKFANIDFANLEDKKEDLMEEISNTKDTLRFFDSKNEDEEDELQNVNDKIENLEEELKNVNDKIEDLEYDFKKLESELSNYNDDLDVNAEELRKHNSSMREAAANIKRYVIENNNGIFNLTQPMQYLKELEKGHDDEISLGVLNKNNLKDITLYLVKHNVIDDFQKTIIDKLNDPLKVIDTLSNEGFKDIKYYNTDREFLKTPQIYQSTLPADTEDVKNKEIRRIKLNV